MSRKKYIRKGNGAAQTLLAVVLTAAVACSVAQVPGGDDGRSSVSQTAEPGSGDYLIGPGDTLSIFVWRQPELSVDGVPVRPDGKLSTPLVEDIIAVGKTPTQLSREIEEVLSQYIRSPEVNVIVRNFVGTFSEQIRVIGQAAQPRALPYRDGMTVMDVMIEVGGLTQYAAGNRSRVVRNVDGETEEIRVRLDDLIRRGRIQHNLRMQPGDVVIIPEAIF